ncbi:MAG TPA: hypothetical protein VHV51_07380 [Polyangiaceae bacterium]|jgi:hypothetical protein|nr:hypothetical protein [Polyangiaceae bacterium]
MLPLMERTFWIFLAVVGCVTALLALTKRPSRAKRILPAAGSTPGEPSTDWHEAIGNDEKERFERYAREYIVMQRRHLRSEGPGRPVHRKQVLGLSAELEVLVPAAEQARYGLFREPGRYQALVRLSNGAAAKKSNKAPDLRGFAIHVAGVHGPSAMGDAETDSQDFVLLNHSWLPFENVDDFVQFGVKADAGPFALAGYLLKRYGVTGIPRQLAALVKLATKPFKGFAHEPFNSVAPFTCGPYAVRVQIVPHASNGEPPAKGQDWVAAFRARLLAKPLTWDLQLQFYSDDLRTPIEDMSLDWIARYVTVARLHIPIQDVTDPNLAKQIEAMTFDVWRHALLEHRPLGNVMRARKVAYVTNAKERGAQL